jgi:hypothetical protein
MTSSRSIVGLISAFGGGDGPQVSTIMAELVRLGHHVTLCCDGKVAPAFLPPDVVTLHPFPVDQTHEFRSDVYKSSGRDWVAGWTEICLPAALSAIQELRPEVLVSSMHCMLIAERIAAELSIP